MLNLLLIIQRSGGALEQARYGKFLPKITLILDNPSARALKLQPTRRLERNDIIILGTGDKLGIVTMTADVSAVKASLAQGIDFNVYLHPSCSLTGV